MGIVKDLEGKIVSPDEQITLVEKSVGIDNSHLFSRYFVKLKIRDRILGGVPTSDDVGKVAERLPLNAPLEERMRVAEERIIESTCTFLYDDEVEKYYLRDANIVAMLREASSVMQVGYATKQLLQHGVDIKPPRIYFDEALSGPLRRPVHVEVRGIPQTTIKMNMYIEKPEMAFEVWVGRGRGKTKKEKFVDETDGKTKTRTIVVPDERLTPQDLQDLFLLGCEVGLGASRAQQWGKFDLLEFLILNQIEG